MRIVGVALLMWAAYVVLVLLARAAVRCDEAQASARARDAAKLNGFLEFLQRVRESVTPGARLPPVG